MVRQRADTGENSFVTHTKVQMADIPNNNSNYINSDAGARKLSPDERTAGRARVAQLLGQLIYKRWQRERERDKERKPKS